MRPRSHEEVPMKRVVFATMLAVSLLLPLSSAPVAATTHFKNCTAMHVKYPHGVGKPGAIDHTTGVKVRTFKKSTVLYNANKSLDRDHDNIACEKR